MACPRSHSQQDEAIGFEPKISCRGAHGLNNSLNLRTAWESRDSSSRLIRADTACRAGVAGAGDLGTAMWELTLGTGLRGLRTVTKRSAPCGLCERLGKDPNRWREWPGDGGGGLGADRSGPREGARGTAFSGFIDRMVPMIRPKQEEGTDGGVAGDGPRAKPETVWRKWGKRRDTARGRTGGRGA